jgi:anti-sigma-K factor RskA
LTVETGVRSPHYGRPSADHTVDAESLAGLYAFGVLEGAELARFEHHLAGCGRCVEVVDGDRAMVMAMSLTAPEAEASPGLKERLLARARAEEPVAPTARGRSLRLVPAAESGSMRLGWLLPMAALIIALLAGGGLLARQVAASRVVATAHMENRLDHGQAVVLVRQNGEGAVQLKDVGDLHDGQVYQAWVIPPGGTPVPTGASASGDGMLALTGDVRGTTIAVTLEPGPGRQTPTVPPIMRVQVPAA